MIPTSFISRNARRRLAALGTLLAAAAVAVGSGANFTSSSANPSNTFSAGTLSQTNSKNGAAVLTASNMKPGDPATVGTVDIANSGSISGTFSLAKSGLTNSDLANPLSAKLTVAIKDCGPWTGSPAVAPDCTGGTPVYSGTIGAMGTQALGAFAGGEKHRYQFNVTFPTGGTAGEDNVYQGDSMSVQYDWSAGS